MGEYFPAKLRSEKFDDDDNDDNNSDNDDNNNNKRPRRRFWPYYFVLINAKTRPPSRKTAAPRSNAGL